MQQVQVYPKWMASVIRKLTAREDARFPGGEAASYLQEARREEAFLLGHRAKLKTSGQTRGLEARPVKKHEPGVLSASIPWETAKILAE